jgi:hypothetical protein
LFFFLPSQGLITKQIHHQRTLRGGGTNTKKVLAQNCQGSLFHLPRFYVERRPPSLLLVRDIIAHLREQPNYMATYEDVRAQIGLSKETKKLFKSPDFQRHVKGDVRVPWRSVYPHAKESEWRRKGSHMEKHIRVVMLINPNVRYGMQQ